MSLKIIGSYLQTTRKITIMSASLVNAAITVSSFGEPGSGDQNTRDRELEDMAMPWCQLAQVRESGLGSRDRRRLRQLRLAQETRKPV